MYVFGQYPELPLKPWCVISHLVSSPPSSLLLFGRWLSQWYGRTWVLETDKWLLKSCIRTAWGLDRREADRRRIFPWIQQFLVLVCQNINWFSSPRYYAGLYEGKNEETMVQSLTETDCIEEFIGTDGVIFSEINCFSCNFRCYLWQLSKFYVNNH